MQARVWIVVLASRHPPTPLRRTAMTIRRTLAAALAASAIAAPAASAMPAPPDMHASTAQAAAQQQRQDLRGEHARDAALNPRKSLAVNAPGATAVASQSKSTPVAPGQPTWAA